MGTFPQGYTLSFTFREALSLWKNLMTNLISVCTHQRTLIVKDNGNFLTICYSRIIRGPADAWRASPRQGTGSEGQSDDAGQGWGAVVDGRLAALMIPLCKF